MAEQFLTLMADLDDDTQAIMSGWYDSLVKAGFTGTQTPGLPYHISLTSFPPEKEREAVEITRTAAAQFREILVHISHIGLFAGGKVLFAAPERSAGLEALQIACASDTVQQYPWTPHATILIDEPQTVFASLPVLMDSFCPLAGKITRLHLCAFWPTREIMSAELSGDN